MPVDAAPSPAPAAPVAPQPLASPLYQQIKALLLGSLQGGEWKPGEAIPSEIELAARFKVSQGTVRKAIDELAAEHLLVRRQGKGTFVATHAEQHVAYRFLRLTADDGTSPTLARRLLDVRRLRAPADVARALALKTGEPVVQLRRVLLDGGRPVVYDEIWLPGGPFKGLTAERLAESRGPMYGLFESEFGVRMIGADERLRAVGASDVAAAALQVAVGTPLLCVERLSCTYGQKPVELRRGLYLTDRHHYRNRLT